MRKKETKKKTEQFYFILYIKIQFEIQNKAQCKRQNYETSGRKQNSSVNL